MSGQHPPLTSDQFKAVLAALGFTKREQRSGTTHESWVATIDGAFRKVTVDCPKAPFSQDLIGSMAKQAGVTKKKIYEIHFRRQAELKPEVVGGTKRFDARKQEGTDEHWCVWDTETNAQALAGL
jgi:hypothetical protein